MNDIKTKIAEDKNDQIDYMLKFLVAKENISLIISEFILNEILERVEIDTDEIEYFNKFKSDDEDIYILTKLTNSKTNKLSIIIEPMENKEVENDLVMVEEFAIDDDKIEKLIYGDIQIIGLEEDHINDEYIEDDEECNCSSCDNFECECNENKVDLEEDYDEVDEFLDCKIDEYENSDMSLYELLEQVYQTAYDDGAISNMIALRDTLDEAIEEN